MNVDDSQGKQQLSQADLFNLSETEQTLINWLRRKQQCTLEEVVAEIISDKTLAKETLKSLQEKNFLKKIEVKGDTFYRLQFPAQKKNKFAEKFLKKIEKKVGRVNFKTLIILTFITVFILIPFVLSPLYLPILRDENFDLHQLFLGDLYKQITGYIALFFVLLEMILTVRKRGKGWFIKISFPGSLILWRSLHIFTGVALLGIILVHTVGATGLNFNAVFLWVFFGVSLSALVGSVAEMAVLESPRRYFGANPNPEERQNNVVNKFLPTFPKAKLIKLLRDIWLSSHIFLVTIFFIMLSFHIFLAYYYQ